MKFNLHYSVYHCLHKNPPEQDRHGRYLYLKSNVNSYPFILSFNIYRLTTAIV